MAHVETHARAPRPGSAAPRFAVGRHRYLRAPEPIHFPSEESPEEAVSETKRHLEARTTLYLLLRSALSGCSVGSDQFVYSDAADPRKCLSPDVFVKLASRDNDFDTWKVWERGAPELAVEIVSASDRRDDDWADKLARYHASGVREVVRFDAQDEAQPLRVWDRVDGDLMERAPESTLLKECSALGLWWAVVPSAEYGLQLRLARDREGRDLLATPDETSTRLAAELAEERKARALAEHERIVADHERKLADHERKRADQERQRAEAALALAEQRQRDETAAKEVAERERDAALEELKRLRGQLAGKPSGS